MAAQPVLSICVPSRNRQFYFQETVKALLETTRQDVQFVFADNSDDPSIMNGFMATYKDDPRAVYLPTTDKVLSMAENWERTLDKADGKWITVIGDDDYADPEIASLLLYLEQTAGPVDSLSWNPVNYFWPEENKPPRTVILALSNALIRLDKRDLVERAFQWVGARQTPRCQASVYHGAVSRELLHHIRRTFDERFFETAVVDFEMAFKVVLLGQNFFKTDRPLSVGGICPQSNSAHVNNIKSQDISVERSDQEFGISTADDPVLSGEIFQHGTGVAAAIYLAQLRLVKKYGLPHSGFETNLVRAMIYECSLHRDPESFEIQAERYRKALAVWNGGAFLHEFKPEYVGGPLDPESNSIKMYGVNQANQTVMIPGDAGNAKTAKDIYDFAAAFFKPAAELALMGYQGQ